MRVTGRVVVNNYGTIRIGDRVRFFGRHLPIEIGSLQGGELIVGENTFINGGCSIVAQELVRIGRNCAIGNLTLIMDSDFHVPGNHGQPAPAKPVVVEDDVWIAARVTVLKGVTIGKGATVAAGAVVTRDVPARTVVAGVPARVIRHLDDSLVPEAAIVADERRR